jgi:hypothetical protein
MYIQQADSDALATATARKMYERLKRQRERDVWMTQQQTATKYHPKSSWPTYTPRQYAHPRSLCNKQQMLGNQRRTVLSTYETATQSSHQQRTKNGLFQKSSGYDDDYAYANTFKQTPLRFARLRPMSGITSRNKTITPRSPLVLIALPAQLLSHLVSFLELRSHFRFAQTSRRAQNIAYLPLSFSPTIHCMTLIPIGVWQKLAQRIRPVRLNLRCGEYDETAMEQFFQSFKTMNHSSLETLLLSSIDRNCDLLLQQLPMLRNRLRSFGISIENLSGKVVNAIIQRLPELDLLQLTYSNVSKDVNWSQLGKLRLRCLHIRARRIPPLKWLTCLQSSHLQELQLESYTIYDSQPINFQNISCLEQLRELTLDNVQNTDLGFLKPLNRLKALALRNVADFGLAAMQRLVGCSSTYLTELALSGYDTRTWPYCDPSRPFTAEALELVTNRWPQLEIMTLRNCNLQKSCDLVALGHCAAHLCKLGLAEELLLDYQAFQAISELPNLTYLRVETYSTVTIQDLNIVLSECLKLQTLVVRSDSWNSDDSALAFPAPAFTHLILLPHEKCASREILAGFANKCITMLPARCHIHVHCTRGIFWEDCGEQCFVPASDQQPSRLCPHSTCGGVCFVL